MGDQNQCWRDEAIARDIRALLAHDPARPLDGLSLDVRGGVVHLVGEVADEAQRERVSGIVRSVRGVFALWDLAAAGARPLAAVDIGCGRTTQDPAAIGVDVPRTPAVAVQADLDRGLPFRDSSVDRVFAVHVLEHIRDLFALMDDLHRVLRPGGVLHVMVPHAAHANALADPTHIRFFNVQTFKYFCRPQASMQPWWPLIVTTDGASIFADLRPIAAGEEAGEPWLARWFD